MKELYTLEEQLELEERYKQLAENNFQAYLCRQREKGRLGNTIMAKGVEKVLLEAFTTNVREMYEQTLSKKRGARKVYHDFLLYLRNTVGDEKAILTLCAHTLQVVFNGLFTNGLTVSKASLDIVNNAYTDLKCDIFLARYPDLQNTIKEGLAKRVKMYKKVAYLQRTYTKYDIEFYKLSTPITAGLGVTLVELFIASSDLFEYYGGHIGKLSCIGATQKLIDLWKEAEARATRRVGATVPTIIKPLRWTDLADGSYYGALATKEVKMLRIPQYILNTRLGKRYKEMLNEIDLSYVQDAMERIANTPFKVNPYMLQVLRDIVDRGGDLAGIAKIEPYPEIGMLEGNYTKEELKAHKHKMVERIHKEIARRTKALKVLNILKIAEDFSKYDVMYIPVSMDFRGRIYAIPQLSYQGEDMTKALLSFADPVPCKREEDLDLLKIQGCNLSGNDKISLTDRVKWVDKNEEHILNSAEDPLGYTWWQDQDEPMQFLAFCHEYSNAKEYLAKHGTIIGYKCGIAIAFDGTCSGLQHYSALLRDERGGKAVNLIDGDVPSDIYNTVAKLVEKQAEYDAIHGTPDGFTKNGHDKIGTRNAAKTWLAHGITRKVCKRPVMTLPYGATKRGFEMQIYEDSTKGNIQFAGVEKACARWLASAIWNAVDQVIVSATQGMIYLQTLSKQASKNNYPVMWWTPIGLPVMQHYLKCKDATIKTRIGARMSKPVHFRTVCEDERIDVMKQSRGVAPNFIHSLDATHLMMTVNEANLRNYQVVHDSFATSLGEASILQKVIREQFYKLYVEHDPLGDFENNIQRLLGLEKVEVERPQFGNLDLTNVLRSKYIFH